MKKLLIGILLILSPAVLADEVRLVTLEYPPYTTQSRANGGSMIELTKRAFALSGHTAIIEFRPWARAQKEMSQGKYDGIMLLWPEEVTAAKVIASRPLAYSELGFFCAQRCAFNLQRTGATQGATGRRGTRLRLSGQHNEFWDCPRGSGG